MPSINYYCYYYYYYYMNFYESGLTARAPWSIIQLDCSHPGHLKIQAQHTTPDFGHIGSESVLGYGV